MRLIEKTDIVTWAGRYEAKARFPYIISKLISEVVSPQKLRIGFGDAVWLHGFDAVVLNSEENRFVPTGLSVWEFSTEEEPKKPAQDNYDKRSKDAPEDIAAGKAISLQLDRRETTFVFVTPRVWEAKEAWVAERKKDNIWKNVVVKDAVDLMNWLEAAPATYVEFAPEVGITPDKGWQSPDQAWDEWRYLTKWPASEELVLIGREEQKKEVLGRLLGSPSTFVIRGDSPREAWGFALATIRVHSPKEEQFSLHARTIVADDERVALNLGTRKHLKDHIIVLKQALGPVSGILSSKGCYVIVPLGNDAILGHNHIVLARPPHHEFATALVRMGLLDDESMRIGRECGRSITILQRLHPHANAQPPRWADDENVIQLLPAVLAGRWNERSEADQKILCQLAGVADYATVENRLRHFLRVDEPPLQKVGEMWTLTAPVDAFQLTAWRLTVADLERFKDAFRVVFGRIDPKVEVPLDDWIYQDIKGEHGHSGWLRSGLAETLLLIAELGANAQLDCKPSPSAYVEVVVRGLPGLNDDWRLLASIRDQYPRLMEATPAPFLDSLERLLEARPDDVRRLFAEGEMMFGSPMHTDLLWGLELLAWNSDYLPRVALILAKLASIDPGGRWMNRPINSLADIFLWWHPGTNATVNQRLHVIDLILNRYPEIGWSLLAKLLPGGLSFGTARPRWRDIGELPEDSRTRSGQAKYASAIIDRALNSIGSHPERWRLILHVFRGLNVSQQEKAFSLLNAIAEGPTPIELKVAFWQILRDFISQHRTYEEATWAVSGGLIDRLETILPKLAPVDSIERNRWLFEDWLPRLPSGVHDTEQMQKQVEELRKEAVKEILNTQGIEGVIKLGTTCQYPGFVATVIVPMMPDVTEIYSLLRQAISVGEPGVSFASHISGRALELHGEKWRQLINKETGTGTWTSSIIASLFIWWPDDKRTWENAATLGVTAEYWRKKPVFQILGTPEEQAYQIDRLIEVKRAAQVFSHAAYWGRGTQTDALLRLFDAAMNELFQMQTAEEVKRTGLHSYYVREFLNELRTRPDLPRIELAHREYRALPVLGPLDAEGLTLHEFMAEDPNFFVDVLCDVYRPANRDKEQDTEPTAEAQAKARIGYTLLQGMVQIPGRREGNQIDMKALVEWTDAVRKKATEMDRADVADIHIGQILAHSSEDPEDKAWPHQVVRTVIESLAAEEIEQGLMIERFNMRGVVSKSLFEGGAQEGALASQYRGWADTCRARWLRTAQVLERIAQNWEEDARREDTRAEQDKLED